MRGSPPKEKELSQARAKLDVVVQQTSKLNKAGHCHQEKLRDSEIALSQKQAEHAVLTAEYRVISDRGLTPSHSPAGWEHYVDELVSNGQNGQDEDMEPSSQDQEELAQLPSRPNVVAGKRRSVFGALSLGDIVEREMDNLSAEEASHLQAVVAQKMEESQAYSDGIQAVQTIVNEAMECDAVLLGQQG